MPQIQQLLQIVQAHPALIVSIIPAAYIALYVRKLFWACR